MYSTIMIGIEPFEFVLVAKEAKKLAVWFARTKYPVTGAHVRGFALHAKGTDSNVEFRRTIPLFTTRVALPVEKLRKTRNAIFAPWGV